MMIDFKFLRPTAAGEILACYSYILLVRRNIVNVSHICKYSLITAINITKLKRKLSGISPNVLDVH